MPGVVFLRWLFLCFPITDRSGRAVDPKAAKSAKRAKPSQILRMHRAIRTHNDERGPAREGSPAPRAARSRSPWFSCGAGSGRGRHSFSGGTSSSYCTVHCNWIFSRCESGNAWATASLQSATASHTARFRTSPGGIGFGSLCLKRASPSHGPGR